MVEHAIDNNPNKYLKIDKNIQIPEITETIKLLEELQRANYLNAILLDSIPHPALLVNKNREVIAANKLAKEAGTLVGGYCWRDFGHCLYISDEERSYVESGNCDNSKSIACYFCQANSALSMNGKVNIEKKLGDIYWDIYWVPTQEKDVYLHYAIDITERKKIEEVMRNVNITLNDAQHIAHLGNINIDFCSKSVYWSDEIFRIFGYQPQEFIPEFNSYEKHIFLEDRKLIGCQFEERTPFDPSFNIECRFEKLNGKEGWLNIKGDFEFNSQTCKLNRAVIIIQDITDKKQAELAKKANEENIRLLRETLEMDRLKTEFFANVSHELRTPLNIIFSTLQLIEFYVRNGLSDDQGKKIGKRLKDMRQNCYRLLRLINNLIDVTKVDGGFISFQPENIDIVDMIRKICVSITEYMEDKHIIFSFTNDIDKKIIACDPDKIETIILNLISNAIKFNKPGGYVTVNIHNEGEDILISVEDSGVGIPRDKQGMIFERFMQVDKSLTRKHEGSGIGLALVKSFVEMHEGEIWLESDFGKGSNFVVKLPCRVLKSQETDNVINNSFRKDHNDFIERINIEFSDIYT